MASYCFTFSIFKNCLKWYEQYLRSICTHLGLFQYLTPPLSVDEFVLLENGSDYIEILNSAILGPYKFSGALQEFYFISKSSLLSFNFITNDVIEKEGCTFDVTATMESSEFHI